MGEFPSLQEQEGKITRDSVIYAYRKFVEAGISNPDDLDLNDPEVRKAHDLFYAWQTQENARAEENEELQRQIDISKTMLYVDAGFTDPDYLNEVLHEWLLENAQNAEIQEDNPARTETRRQIAEAIKKIRKLLESEQVVDQEQENFLPYEKIRKIAAKEIGPVDKVSYQEAVARMLEIAKQEGLANALLVVVVQEANHIEYVLNQPEAERQWSELANLYEDDEELPMPVAFVVDGDKYHF